MVQDVNIIVWLININFIAISLLLIVIAWQDIVRRTITHRNLLFLLLLLIPLLLLRHQTPNISAALLILLVGFVLFMVNVIGGGDVKFVSLLSLSLPHREVIIFLYTIAFLGGIVTLTGLIFFRRQIREQGVPYGVAISLAYILVYPLPPFFSLYQDYP